MITHHGKPQNLFLVPLINCVIHSNHQSKSVLDHASSPSANPGRFLPPAATFDRGSGSLPCVWSCLDSRSVAKLKDGSVDWSLRSKTATTSIYEGRHDNAPIFLARTEIEATLEDAIAVFFTTTVEATRRLRADSSHSF
ncbi:hypothetical protein Ae201684P_009519 [Aphanomyces euteiches]|nr:hypothetical protein Ae201684P_009519 [Aphanomyces euteiches]